MQLVRVEDDRPLLERLRRIELWRLADQFRVPYPIGATKNDMVARLREAQERGLDFKKPPPTVPDVPLVASVAESAKRLEDMTISELRSECKAAGIKIERTDNKARLLAKLAPPLPA